MGEVGEGAGDFEDAVVGAGGEVHVVHGVLEVGAAFGVELTVGFHLSRGHGAVDVGAGAFGEALGLDGAGLLDAGADGGGGFALFGGGEGFVVDEGDFDMEIDAVEERAADALAVFLDEGRATAAFAFGIAIIAAGAGVHSGDKHEAGGEGHAADGAGDGDFAVFEGLAHDFEGAAAELGEFVEEEDAIVGHADFAGARVGTAAEESGVADGVVGGAEGAGGDEGGGFAEEAGGAVDFGGFDGFFFAHAGHEGDDAFGDHGFAGAGWADHEEVVAAGDGDFHGTLGVVLAFDIGEVEVVVAGGGEELGCAAGFGWDVEFAFEEEDGFLEVGGADDVDAADDAGFGGAAFGDDEAGAATGAGFEGDGEDAADGAEFAIEGEFADHGGGGEGVDGEAGAVGDEGDGDGEVEAGAFFFEVGGGEIDGGDAVVHHEAATGDGGGDAFAAFFDGGVGESDNDHARGAAAVVGFDFDFDGVDAD